MIRKKLYYLLNIIVCLALLAQTSPLMAVSYEAIILASSSPHHPDDEVQGEESPPSAASISPAKSSLTVPRLAQAPPSLDALPLVPNWNLVSLPKEQPDTDPAAVFANIAGAYSVVYAYDACAAEPWQVFDPNAAPASNDLTAVDHTIGFWIEATTAVTLPVSGTSPLATDIQLCQGWNLIGFPVEQPRPIRNALASIEGKYTRLFAYDPTDPDRPWKGYDVAAPDYANDLTIMEPGKGYWIYATETTTVTFANQGTPPVVAITAPAVSTTDLTTLTTITDVVGTATSDFLQEWSLAHRPLGSSTWTTFFTSTTPVVDGVLGAFDPTLLLNGAYEIGLTAVDYAGQSAFTSVDVVVDGEQKLGVFSLSFVDLSVPVSGIPIEIVRSYDSRYKQRGDFGFGWTLDIRRGVNVQENGVIGEGWTTSSNGGTIPTICVVPTQLHIVAITLGDEIFRFEPVTVPECQVLFPPQFVDVTFRALPGTDATLVPLNSNSAILNGGVLLDDGTFEPIDFKDYRLTTSDGRQYDIDEIDGLERLTQPDGNFLTISSNGISHSSGSSISIQRDGQGRITQITDPASNVLTYDYDTNGDLVNFTNQVNETITYTYRANHYLYSIIDDEGREIAALDYDDDGRLSQSCDVSNNCTQLSHDLDGNTETITDATGRTTIYVYDDKGNVTSVTDSAGHTTTYLYDSQGNLLEETDPNGFVSRYTYDSRGNQLTATDPYDPTDPDSPIYTTAYTYNGRDQVTSITFPSGAQTFFSFDPSGKITEVRDDDGNVMLGFTYGAGGAITSESGPLGTMTYSDHDTFGNPGTITDEFGQVVTATYDALGDVSAYTEEGVTTSFTNDGLGRVTHSETSDGFAVDYTYDTSEELWTTLDVPTLGHVERQVSANGRLVGYTLPDGSQVSFNHDAAGRLTQEVDPKGNVTQFEYDAAGRVSQIDLPNGGQQTLAYDPAGRLIRQTNALSQTTAISYTAAGQIAVMTDPLGRLWTFSHTVTATTMIDPLNRQTTVIRSPEGLPIRQVNADGTFAEAAYLFSSPIVEAEDYPTRITDEGGRVRTYAYDAFAQMTAATDLAGVTYTYGYDGPQLISITNPISEVTALTYDAFDEINSISYADGTGMTFLNRVDGQPLVMTRSSGIVVNYDYDQYGNQITRTASTGEVDAFTWTHDGTLTETVDATGVTQYLYDNLGNLAGINYPNQGRVRYGYDLLNRVISITTQVSPTAPLYQTTYDYDEVGNLTAIIDPLGGLTTMAYDAVGRLITKTLPNNVTTVYGYNDRDQVMSMVHQDSGGGVIASVTYERTGIGEPTRITREDGSYVLLGYDGALRLTSEAYYDAADTLLETITYTYDAAGNRTTYTDAAGASTYTYQPGGQLVGVAGPGGNETYAYDGDGRTTTIDRDGLNRTLSYDSRDRLTAVTNLSGTAAISYTYDALDRRVQVEGPQGTRHFMVAPALAQGLEAAHLVMDDSGTVLAGYVYAGEHPLMRFGPDGPVYYLDDAQGSVLALADGTGSGVANFHYDGFGNVRSAAGASAAPPAALGGDFRFHGAWLESQTNLYHLRARDYDARIGRFLSRDAADPDLQRPETLHPYLFAQANPYVYRDPSGFFSIVSVNISINIQGILNAIPRVAFRFAIDMAKDAVGQLISNALIKLLAGMLTLSSPNSIQRQGNRNRGHVFEDTMQSLICNIIGGGAWLNYVWFEVPVARSGKPAGNGFHCPGGSGGSGFGNKHPRPDFLISKYQPTTLDKNPGDPKSYVIGDFKLKVGTAWQKWKKPNNSQFEALANHAADYEYLPFVLLVTWTGSKATLNQQRLLQKFLRKGVILVIVSIR